MFDVEEVVTETGHKWMVLADSPGCGSGVVVLEGGTEGMTDEEVGREVKRLMKRARLLNAKVWAKIIMQNSSGVQFGGDETIKLLGEFKNEDELIAVAYYRKIQARTEMLVSNSRKHDRQMKKTLGRNHAPLLQAVIKRDGYKCNLCSKSDSTDSAITLHLAFKEREGVGGQATAMNLELICLECL